MCNSPIPEEMVGQASREMRTAVQDRFFTNSISDEDTSETGYKARSYIFIEFHDGPVAIYVDYDDVVPAFVAEVALCSGSHMRGLLMG